MSSSSKSYGSTEESSSLNISGAGNKTCDNTYQSITRGGAQKPSEQRSSGKLDNEILPRKRKVTDLPSLRKAKMKRGFWYCENTIGQAYARNKYGSWYSGASLSKLEFIADCALKINLERNYGEQFGKEFCEDVETLPKKTPIPAHKNETELKTCNRESSKPIDNSSLTSHSCTKTLIGDIEHGEELQPTNVLFIKPQTTANNNTEGLNLYIKRNIGYPNKNNPGPEQVTHSNVFRGNCSQVSVSVSTEDIVLAKPSLGGTNSVVDSKSNCSIDYKAILRCECSEYSKQCMKHVMDSVSKFLREEITRLEDKGLLITLEENISDDFLIATTPAKTSKPAKPLCLEDCAPSLSETAGDFSQTESIGNSIPVAVSPSLERSDRNVELVRKENLKDRPKDPELKETVSQLHKTRTISNISDSESTKAVLLSSVSPSEMIGGFSKPKTSELTLKTSTQTRPKHVSSYQEVNTSLCTERKKSSINAFKNEKADITNTGNIRPQPLIVAFSQHQNTSTNDSLKNVYTSKVESTETGNTKGRKEQLDSSTEMSSETVLERNLPVSEFGYSEHKTHNSNIEIQTQNSYPATRENDLSISSRTITQGVPKYYSKPVSICSSNSDNIELSPTFDVQCTLSSNSSPEPDFQQNTDPSWNCELKEYTFHEKQADELNVLTVIPSKSEDLSVPTVIPTKSEESSVSTPIPSKLPEGDSNADVTINKKIPTHQKTKSENPFLCSSNTNLTSTQHGFSNDTESANTESTQIEAPSKTGIEKCKSSLVLKDVTAENHLTNNKQSAKFLSEKELNISAHSNSCRENVFSITVKEVEQKVPFLNGENPAYPIDGKSHEIQSKFFLANVNKHEILQNVQRSAVKNKGQNTEEVPKYSETSAQLLPDYPFEPTPTPSITPVLNVKNSVLNQEPILGNEIESGLFYQKKVESNKYTKEELVSSLKEKLQNKYLKEFLEMKIPNTSYSHNLSTIYSEYYTVMTKEENSEEIEKQYGFYNIFALSKTVKRIIINGGPAFGKTYLCTLLARYWSLGKFPMDSFNICLKFRFNELHFHTPNVLRSIVTACKQLLNVQNKSIDEEYVYILLKEIPKIVIILDGYDEVSYSFKDAVGAFLQHISETFKNCILLVSTRPGFHNVPFFKQFQRHVLIKPCSAEVAGKLLEKNVVHRNKSLKSLEAIPYGWKVCYLSELPPVFAFYLCKTFLRDDFLKQKDVTLYDLLDVTLSLVIMETCDITVPNFSYNIEETFIRLGKLYFAALVKGYSTFQEDLLRKVLENRFELIVRCNFVYQERDSLQTSPNWTTSKVLLIFFATKYLRFLWAKHDEESRREEFLKRVLCFGDCTGHYVIGSSNESQVYFVGFLPEIVLKLENQATQSKSSIEMYYDVEAIERSQAFDSVNLLVRIEKPHLHRYGFENLYGERIEKHFELIFNYLDAEDCCIQCEFYENKYEGKNFLKVNAICENGDYAMQAVFKTNVSSNLERLYMDFPFQHMRKVLEILKGILGYCITDFELGVETDNLCFGVFVSTLVCSVLNCNFRKPILISCYGETEVETQKTVIRNIYFKMFPVITNGECVVSFSFVVYENNFVHTRDFVTKEDFLKSKMSLSNFIERYFKTASGLAVCIHLL